jgi:hypothetical protein
MADETLLLLIREVRGRTLRLLETVTDEEAGYAPAGLQNSILWHAGHAWVLAEALGVAAATGRAVEYPPGWYEMFSWKSRPGEVRDWPDLGVVVQRLVEQEHRLATAVEGLGEAELGRVMDERRGRTVRYSILHGLHDEASHQGEMWLLRKLYAKAAGPH